MIATQPPGLNVRHGYYDLFSELIKDPDLLKNRIVYKIEFQKSVEYERMIYFNYMILRKTP
jgi:hypothetical protein